MGIQSNPQAGSALRRPAKVTNNGSQNIVTVLDHPNSLKLWRITFKVKGPTSKDGSLHSWPWKDEPEKGLQLLRTRQDSPERNATSTITTNEQILPTSLGIQEFHSPTPRHQISWNLEPSTKQSQLVPLLVHRTKRQVFLKSLKYCVNLL